jgi:hypothetical protein
VDILLVNRNLTSLFRAAEDRFPITHHREDTGAPEIRGLLHEAANIDEGALALSQPRARDHGWQPRLGGDLGPRPASPAGSPPRGSDHAMPDHPVAEPPAGPFVAEPPAAEAPAAEPPVAEPPVAEPPVAEPPAAALPAAEPPAAEPPVAEPPVADGRAFGPIAVGPIAVGPPDAGPIAAERPAAGPSTVEHPVGLPTAGRRAAGPIAVGPPAARRTTPTRTKAARATPVRTKPAPTSPTTRKRATPTRATPTRATPTRATPAQPVSGRPTPKRSKAKRGKPTRTIRKTALVAPVPTAFCPYCALILEPPPASSRRCPRCRQRIIVKRVEGRAVYLTEAAVMVFEAERQRIASSSRLTRDRERWLKLAAAAGAPAERTSRLAAAALSEKVVDAARTLYVSTVERAFRAAKRSHDWATASRIRREEAFALYRLGGSPLPPPTALVAMLREGVAAELRGIAGISRDAELVSATCCDICQADDGRIFRIAHQLRVPRLPHEGCPKGLCRCGWDLAARDRTTMRRYMRRRSGTETRAGPDEPATTA